MKNPPALEPDEHIIATTKGKTDKLTKVIIAVTNKRVIVRQEKGEIKEDPQANQEVWFKDITTLKKCVCLISANITIEVNNNRIHKLPDIDEEKVKNTIIENAIKVAGLVELGDKKTRLLKQIMSVLLGIPVTLIGLGIIYYGIVLGLVFGLLGIIIIIIAFLVGGSFILLGLSLLTLEKTWIKDSTMVLGQQSKN